MRTKPMEYQSISETGLCRVFQGRPWKVLPGKFGTQRRLSKVLPGKLGPQHHMLMSMYTTRSMRKACALQMCPCESPYHVTNLMEYQRISETGLCRVSLGRPWKVLPGKLGTQRRLSKVLPGKLGPQHHMLISMYTARSMRSACALQMYPCESIYQWSHIMRTSFYPPNQTAS